MFADLLNSSYFALFLIVALGFMLGRIKIKGLSLDVSAVIFIALLFGHFGVIIPKELGNFGLVLFIFTIGIQAGPGFFDSFRSKGKTLIIITLLIICSAAQTILHEGDYIQAVGSEEALNQLAVLVGEREEGELPLVDMQEIESLLLTKKDMINKQLGDLNLMKNFGCTVTRIRRSGIDLSPSPDLALKFGDKLMVVGEKDGIKGVARLLGNDTKQLSDTDFFPIALGIVLGVLFGKLNISFSDSLSFSPGLTGGILMVALFLSAIGKTGPILWSMSGPANQLLRQLGLLLFLAEVGTSAGRNLMATFQESGWLLFGVGAAITLVPMLVAVCVGLFVFKINILDLLGTITGGMTSTPGLAAADSMTDSNIPSVAYATVYPIAMVFLILIIQVIASAVY